MEEHRFNEDPAMRIGDAEREEAAETLRRARVEGRLDDEELADRLERAMRAKTAGELAALVADLPRERGRERRRSGSCGRGPLHAFGRRYGIPLPILLALAIVVFSFAIHGHGHLFWLVALFFIVPRFIARRCWRRRGRWSSV